MKAFPSSLALLAIVASVNACAFEFDAYGRPVPDAYGQPYSQPDYSQPQDQYQYGQPVYQAGDCIGAFVNGQCYGSPTPRAQVEQGERCYGTMVAGECIGARF